MGSPWMARRVDNEWCGAILAVSDISITLAVCLPSRRAGAVDPNVALRYI